MFRRILLFILLIIIILMIELETAYYLNLSFIMPQLLLILVLFYAWWDGPIWGQLIGFFTGIIRDVFDIGVFGTNILLFTILGFFVGNISMRMDKHSISSQVTIVCVCSIVYLLGFYCVQLISYYNFAVKFQLLYWLKPVVNAIWAPIVFFIYNFIAIKLFKVDMTNVAK